jgi:NUMOD3 motif
MSKSNDERKYYCYIYFHPVFGYPIYVGQGLKHRVRQHYSGSVNTKLNALIDEYGHAVPSLIVRNNLTKAEAIASEKDYIAAIGREADGSGPLYNISPGGYDVAPETRTKMSAVLIGNKRGVGNQNHLGHKHSAEVRAKMSASVQNRFESAEERAKASVSQIKRFESAEERAKIGAVTRERWQDDSYRERRSAETKLLWQNPEYREKRRIAQQAYFEKRKAAKFLEAAE